MTRKCVLTKTYRWMIVSNDGLLKTPRYEWGEMIFKYSYPTEEEAVADYQLWIDNFTNYFNKMVLISEYSAEYVF